MKNEAVTKLINDTFKAYERRERREAYEDLERRLQQVKASLYGLAGYGLPDGPLKDLKQSITNCINQAWRLKEGGER